MSEMKIQYVIVQQDAAPSTSKRSVGLVTAVANKDAKLLDTLVLKYNVEGASTTAEKSSKWDAITNEFHQLGGSRLTKEQVRKKWGHLRAQKRKKAEQDMQHLKASIADALGGRAQDQTFEIQQLDDSTGETTTIVLLNNDGQPTDGLEENVIHLDASSAADDLIEMALTESGVVRQSEEENNRLVTQEAEVEEEDSATLQQYQTQEDDDWPSDVHTARRRLKWEKRLRSEETTFQRKHKDIIGKINSYKSKCHVLDEETVALEQSLSHKQQEAQSVQKELERINRVLNRTREMGLFA